MLLLGVDLSPVQAPVPPLPPSLPWTAIRPPPTIAHMGQAGRQANDTTCGHGDIRNDGGIRNDGDVRLTSEPV